MVIFSMRNIFTLVCFTFCLILFSAGADAQDVTFTASVDKNIIAMGEQIEVTFTLSGSKGGSNFRAPSFDDFVVLSGPNQMNSMQFINGAMSVSTSYSYVIQPRSEGKFTIGPASIRVDGKQLNTQPITIEVRKGSSQQQRSQRSEEQNDLSRQIGENIFLRVVVDKSRVYQGEQVTASYKLYWRIALASNPSINKIPALSGFWNEEIDMPKQGGVSREIIDGKQYNVATLKKYALFPQRTGTLTIDPMELDCIVQVQTRRRSNDIFDQFFNDPFFGNTTNVNHKVRNQPVNINVLPLPLDDQPTDFSGAVGSFSVESWLDKHQVKANEPVVLKVKITGKGNVRLIEAPKIVTSPDIERYDPKIYDNITTQGDQVAGSRTFEYLMIPRYPGEQKIPSFSFSYFDLSRKKYNIYKSPDFVIQVEKSDGIKQTYATGISKEDVKLLGEDIRFIKSETASLKRSTDKFAGSVLFFVMAVLPLITFAGLFVALRKREKFYGNITLVKNRRARKIASRRLLEARKFLQSKNKEEFYAEISRALYGYLGDKLNIPRSDLTIENVCSTLLSQGVSQDTIDKLSKVLESCEFARFAPSENSHQMELIYSESAELISTLENIL